MGARERAVKSVCEYASLDIGSPDAAAMSFYDSGFSYSGAVMCDIIKGRCERFQDGTLLLDDAINCGRRFDDDGEAEYVLRVPAGDPRVEVAERLLMGQVLERNKWNVSRSANKLGIHRSTLIYKMRKYGITR